MCKQMMEQRHEIEQDIQRAAKRAAESFREHGRAAIPSVIIDLEKLWKANKVYFEQNGFCFEPSTRVEDGRLKYYAIMRPIFNGELADLIRHNMHQAEQEFVMRQRNALQAEYNHRVKEHGKSAAQVAVNLREIMLDNKAFFEEQGFYFEPRTGMTSPDQFSVWMKKR